MSEFVMVKRELLEDLLGSAETEAHARRAALGDFRPKVQAELDRVVAETRAVLAQEAGSGEPSTICGACIAGTSDPEHFDSAGKCRYAKTEPEDASHD